MQPGYFANCEFFNVCRQIASSPDFSRNQAAHASKRGLPTPCLNPLELAGAPERTRSHGVSFVCLVTSLASYHVKASTGGFL